MEKSYFLDTINGKECDRPPVWFMRQAGRTSPAYMKLREKYSFSELMKEPQLACDVTLQPVHELGVDAAILFSDILVIPEAMGMNLEFSDKGPIFPNPIKDMDLQDIFKNLNPDLSKFDHIYKAIKLICEQKPEHIPLIGFCGGPLTVLCYMIQGISRNHNFPDAIKMIYKEKTIVKKLIDLITELSIEYAITQAKSGVSTFQLFETHAGLIPEDHYFELFIPAIKKISEAVRAKGIPTIFFPKGFGTGYGKLNSDIADFIGIDWQTSLFDIRKIMDKSVGLQGNLYPQILNTDKETIDNELNKYIEFGSKNRNWIFNLGHGLTPEIPIDNIKYVIDRIKNIDWKRS